MPTMAVDWLAIRKALRMRRTEVDMQVNELRDKSGVSRTTIYRVENIRDLPQYVVDLDTLDALVQALQWTLADLFVAAAGKMETPNPAQREAEHIASLWPYVPESTRMYLKGLVETSAVPIDPQSTQSPALETGRATAQAAEQRHKP